MLYFLIWLYLLCICLFVFWLCSWLHLNLNALSANVIYVTSGSVSIDCFLLVIGHMSGNVLLSAGDCKYRVVKILDFVGLPFKNVDFVLTVNLHGDQPGLWKVCFRALSGQAHDSPHYEFSLALHLRRGLLWSPQMPCVSTRPLHSGGSQVSPPLCRRWQLFSSQNSLSLFFAWLPGISSAYAQHSIKRKTQVGPRRISVAPGSCRCIATSHPGLCPQAPSTWPAWAPNLSPWLSETVMFCLVLPLGRKSAAVGLISSAPFSQESWSSAACCLVWNSCFL